MQLSKRKDSSLMIKLKFHSKDASKDWYHHNAYLVKEWTRIIPKAARSNAWVELITEERIKNTCGLLLFLKKAAWPIETLVCIPMHDIA